MSIGGPHEVLPSHGSRMPTAIAVSPAAGSAPAPVRWRMQCSVALVTRYDEETPPISVRTKWPPFKNTTQA